MTSMILRQAGGRRTGGQGAGGGSGIWSVQPLCFLSPMNIIVQNGYLLPHILVPYHLMFYQISILASDLYYAIRDCYC